MAHDELINRIRKTLYFGCDGMIDDDLEMSSPLAEYAADLFSETHKGYSLNRLHQVTVDKLEVSPCSLIMALIYLDRLNTTDPKYVRQMTPTELFLLSIVSDFLLLFLLFLFVWFFFLSRQFRFLSSFLSYNFEGFL